MGNEWPALPLAAWRDTYATLHMWTQIVGKVCLALTPLSNHFWNIAFQVMSRGLATPSLTTGRGALTITFDFVDHRLVLQRSDGVTETIPLEPRTVADFYRLTMEALRRIGVDVRIWTMPVEVPDPIRFEADTTHRSYDPAAANACWRALVAMKPLFETFRCAFVGKCSPVHFFWGSFDLAVTRFSGRRAPARPGADSITREAYSHEVISHGFWPGGGAVQEPAFYAYAAPEPAGFKNASVRPAAAFYSTDLHEFVLPYEAVRTAASPAMDLTAFLETTYDRAATLAGWNRSDLERKGDGHGRPGLRAHPSDQGPEGTEDSAV
ncbi:MAG TPA: DUF5996 family protein [Thermoleophilia bacterium]|nr:DUF5996 family protein [Thermoleophilia bacterium]